MTIASELTKLNTNLTNSYTAVSGKGGTIPQAQNFDNLATAISSIPTGGGGSVDHGGEFLVRVIDYDGTILKEDHLNTGDTFTLPSAPSHERLTFQEWSSSAQIVDNTITVGQSDIMVGPIYTTVSGKNEFDIELNSYTGLTLNLYMDGTKDWGDGTIDTNTSHTYALAGKYTITCDGTSKTSGSTSSMIGNGAMLKNAHFVSLGMANYLLYYCDGLESVTFAKNVGTFVGRYALSGCKALKAFICPNEVTTLSNYAFAYDYNLENIVIPHGLTTINQGSLSNLYSLRRIGLPSTITSMNNNSVDSLYGLQSITIPAGVSSSLSFQFAYTLQKITYLGNVTSVDSYAYPNCESMQVYDFSNNTQVPSISGGPFYYDTGFIIKVPSSLYSQWIAASIWSSYATHIIAV